LHKDAIYMNFSSIQTNLQASSFCDNFMIKHRSSIIYIYLNINYLDIIEILHIYIIVNFIS